MWPALVRTAALDQVRRMVQGAYVVPVLLTVLWVATPYPSDHPVAYLATWIAAASSAVIRLVLGKRGDSFYDTHPRAYLGCFYAAGVLTSSANGLLYAHALVAYGFENWTFTIIMLFTVGGVSGSTISFTPTLKLLRIYVLLMFVPAMVVGVVHGGREGYTYVVATLILLLFLLLQGKRLNSAYWCALENKVKDAIRSRELEVARQSAEEAQSTAEAANAAKGQFLANMSHEIRTPMHGILGMTQIAMASSDPIEVRESLEVVRSSAEALLHVLNDILDFSKVEAGKITFEIIPFAIADVVAEVRGLLDGRLRIKGLDSEWTITPEVPKRVMGDPTRLKQVLINLLGNAIKFCERGSVTLYGDLAEDGAIRFAISDTGIGIPKEQQETIFAAFSQGDGSVARKFGGTGLGLAICSELVRLMGGRIWVESNAGEGSTFLFTTRLSAANDLLDSPLQSLQADVQFTRQLSILLAEDNPINQRLAARFLGSRGHLVAVVGSGADAVRLACAQQFDVILMDNQMPGMGGVEATGYIRQHEESNGRQRTPIVALTASAMRGDRERFLEAGMDSYLAKPFRAEELFAAITALTEPIR